MKTAAPPNPKMKNALAILFSLLLRDLSASRDRDLRSIFGPHQLALRITAELLILMRHESDCIPHSTELADLTEPEQETGLVCMVLSCYSRLFIILEVGSHDPVTVHTLLIASKFAPTTARSRSSSSFSAFVTTPSTWQTAFATRISRACSRSRLVIPFSLLLASLFMSSYRPVGTGT